MKTKKEKVLPTTKAGWIAFIYKSCSNGIRAAKSNAPREWLAKKGLSIDATGACFNSGQMHHRQEQSFKMALAEVGFMQKSTVGVNSDTVPYTVFGIFSIMFPLRNESNEVVNFYSIRIRSENTAYMNQEPGLYPGYPSELTKRLFVVNTVMEAATILESKVLDNKEAVIALHDGKVMPEHERAIKRLTALVEVIYIESPAVKTVKEKKVWDRSKK
ncbi:MAG: hypothetical protein IT234_00430 [Bacteroidia bacterium]|nr:hypothetical protein [Bacteroidia bacterium]